MKDKLTKLINVYKKYGFVGFMKKAYRYVIANYIDKVSLKVMFNKKKYRKSDKNIEESGIFGAILV